MNDPLVAADLRHVWHPFTQMKTLERLPPVVIDHAEGVWLYDRQGRRWLDGIASWWVNLLGHHHPRLDSALKAQLDKMAHVMFARFTHEPAVELAQRLVSLAPAGLTRVFYSDNGSTAVEAGLRMAFQFWHNQGQHRSRFIALDRAYHGDTMGAVSLGGIPTFHGLWGPLCFPVLRAPSPHAFPRPAGQDPGEVARASLRGVEALLAAHPGEVAAVVVEPLIQAAGGMAVYPAGWLTELRALCDQADTLLLVDEVATGFFRTGRAFASDHAGISPDIMAVSKAITGGYMPLGATLCTERVFSAFYGDQDRTFYYGHSYTGNPLACALGVEVLSIVADPAWQAPLAGKAALLQRCFARLGGHPHVGEVRGLGFVAALELLEDPETGRAFDPARAVGRRVCELAWERGLFIRPLGDVVYLWPPLAISEAEIEWAVAVIAECIDAAARP